MFSYSDDSTTSGQALCVWARMERPPPSTVAAFEPAGRIFEDVRRELPLAKSRLSRILSANDTHLASGGLGCFGDRDASRGGGSQAIHVGSSEDSPESFFT